MLRKIDHELINALICDDHKRVLKALKEGANPNLQIEGRTLPYIETSDTTKDLTIEAGLPVNNYALFHEYTPLHLAALSPTPQSATHLIIYGADVRATDDFGQTSLHFAKHPDTANLLCMRGADVNAKDKLGYNPIHMNPSAELLTKLLELGADPHATIFHDRTNPEDGKNALHTTKSAAAVKILLENNVDPTVVDAKFGATALHRATDPDAIELLVAAGIHVNTTDKFGQTPLHRASNQETVLKLIELGASVGICNSKGYTPAECQQHTLHNTDLAKTIQEATRYQEAILNLEEVKIIDSEIYDAAAKGLVAMMPGNAAILNHISSTTGEILTDDHHIEDTEDNGSGSAAASAGAATSWTMASDEPSPDNIMLEAVGITEEPAE